MARLLLLLLLAGCASYRTAQLEREQAFCAERKVVPEQCALYIEARRTRQAVEKR